MITLLNISNGIAWLDLFWRIVPVVIAYVIMCCVSALFIMLTWNQVIAQLIIGVLYMSFKDALCVAIALWLVSRMCHIINLFLDEI